MAGPDQSPLPKYRAPPVIETVLGVEFTRLEKWGIPYFGLLWSQIRDEFPNYEVKPPLGSDIEQFDKPKGPPVPQVQILLQPEIRCWFIGADDRTLIQVQGNRFVFNWRKRGVADAYPHYDSSIRPAFQRAWQQFAEFVDQHQLGQVNVVQCEVSYINHLEIGKGWDSAADLHEVFPCWLGKTNGEFLRAPENVGFDVSYRMPDKRGRLRVSMKSAIRHEDGAEILQLTLTARGKPESSEIASVLEWLDMGRKWVVRGFTDFTSENMHTLWQRST